MYTCHEMCGVFIKVTIKGKVRQRCTEVSCGWGGWESECPPLKILSLNLAVSFCIKCRLSALGDLIKHLFPPSWLLAASVDAVHLLHFYILKALCGRAPLTALPPPFSWEGNWGVWLS